MQRLASGGLRAYDVGDAGARKGSILAERNVVTIIVNPISGEGASYHKAALLAKRLDRRGIPSRLWTTEQARQGGTLAHQAAPESRAVVAVGGDGTVNDVVQGLVGTDTPLAVLPTGTANVLAHELGIRKHVSSTVKVVTNRRVRRMDLGYAGGQYFVCMASCGFDAAVTYQMHRHRTGNINYAHYVPMTLKAFWNYDYPELRVTVDGKVLPEPAYHVIIGNTRSYGGPFKIATRAWNDDGLLDVVIFCGRGPVWLGAYLLSTIFRGHVLLPRVHMLRGRRVEIESSGPVPYQLDGDFAGYSPLTAEVREHALAVLMSPRKRG